MSQEFYIQPYTFFFSSKRHIHAVFTLGIIVSPLGLFGAVH
jgi:hypothetical protein